MAKSLFMRVSLTSLRCYALLLLALLPTVLLQAAAPVIGTTSFNSNFGATQTLAGPLANTVTATNVGGSGWDFTSVSTSTNMVISVAAGGNNPGGASDWCIRMPTNNGAISLQSAAVKSNDNSHFNLQTVYLRLNMPPASSSDITLTGYRGGVVVSGATLTKTGNLTNNTLWIKFDVSANSAFNDVDQFIFTQAASSSAIITSMFVDDITIAAPINLPLTLLDFSGQRTDNKVNLQWTTAREENTAGFEVQRADNGADFSTIGMVQAAGNSTQTLHYNYTEALPAISSPAYFYRLKMSDLDGRSTYSPVLKISVPSSGLSFSAYPNPFREQLAITMEAPEADKAQLTIRDMNGQQLLRQDLSIQKGANSFPLPAMVRLPAGLYLLNIATSHQQQTIRVLKIE
jgi:hypothetical protein